MIAEWLPNLLLAWSVQLVGVMSPGPGVALILSVATGAGRRAALTTCVGIGVGAMVLAVATVLGLAALFADIAWAMTGVKVVGAAYLTWLAWKSLGKAVHPVDLPAPGPVATHRRAALAGFTMQITNPKAIFFWLAVAALGNLHGAPLPVLALFVAGAFVNSFSGHGLWALALSSCPFLGVYRRARRWIEGALGIFFAFAAFKLATSRS